MDSAAVDAPPAAADPEHAQAAAVAPSTAADAEHAQVAADESPPEPRKAPRIRWYRAPIDAGLLRDLSRRSDLRGAVQTLGYLGIYATTSTLAIYSAVHFRWYATIPL